MLETKQLRHSERSEEPDNIGQPRFLASLGMTHLLNIQCNLMFAPANVKMCTYAWLLGRESRAIDKKEA